MSSSSAQGAGGWPLRFKTLEEYPIIGKFDEKIDFDKAKMPIRMYSKNEELMEEAEDPTIVKDSEYWKRKKQRRRGFRPKSMLILEDSTPRRINGPPVGLQFEGNITNLNMSDNDQATSSQTRAKPVAKSISEAPFKYVLMEILTTPQSTTEVNVIPVGDWYTFKKPSVTGQKMLDEVDEDFEIKLKRDKEKLSRYRRIAEALESHNSANGGKSDRSSEVEDMSLPPVFGRAVNRALLKGTLGKGMIRKHLDDAGVDIDAGKEYQEFVGGDYTKVHADDEEEYVGNEQVELEDHEAMLAGKVITGIIDAVGTEKDTYFEDDDDSDEEPEDGIRDSDVVGGKDPTTVMLADDLDQSARELGRLMAKEKASKVGEGAVDEPLVEASSTAAPKTRMSALDRQQEDEPSTKRMKTSASSAALASSSTTSSGSMVATSSGVANPATTAANELQLSEDAVRQYIASMGGKAQVSALREYFKPALKRYAKEVKDNKAAANKLLEIVQRITVTEDDAVLGKILRLKS